MTCPSAPGGGSSRCGRGCKRVAAAESVSAQDFAASFDRHGDYHANIGSPGEIEGAAGSLFVEVPVQVYGRLRSGEPFNMLGPVRLRRCNLVPGCSAAQLGWRIAASGVGPRPAG